MLVSILLYCFKYDWPDRVPATNGDSTWVAKTMVSWSKSVSLGVFGFTSFRRTHTTLQEDETSRLSLVVGDQSVTVFSSGWILKTSISIRF